MQETVLDKLTQAYMRGRKDELNDFFKVLEVVRRHGFIDIDTANVIIDHLNRVNRNLEKALVDDGE